MKNILVIVALLSASFTFAQESELSSEVVDLKQSVLQLNRDLYQLEEDLLSPETTRAALYFSLNYGGFFQPMSIQISVDGKKSVQHLYTERQVKALTQGAIQPLQNLNLGPGKHNISVLVKGVDQNGKDRELVLEQPVEKNEQPLYIELKVNDNKDTQNAELLISHW